MVLIQDFCDEMKHVTSFYVNYVSFAGSHMNLLPEISYLCRQKNGKNAYEKSVYYSGGCGSDACRLQRERNETREQVCSGYDRNHP